MRVYQVNVVCSSGSTGRIVADLAQVVQKNSGKCKIAYGRGNVSEDIESIKISNKLDLYFHATMTRLTDKQGLFSKRVTQRLIEDIKEYQPDIIHLHNIHGYYVNYESLFRFLKEYKKPVVWTLHDCWSFTGHCAHFEPIGCHKWKTQCENCELKKAYPQSCFLDNSKENYLRKKKAFLGIQKMVLVTPSKWLKNIVQQSFFKDYPITTISNGIDVEVFHPRNPEVLEREKKILQQKYGIDFSKRVFLGVASVWTKDKGFEDFIKMVNLDIKDFQIILVGVNKKQIEKLPFNIIGVERTENKKELSSLYACSDVFLNPTYADTFPTVNMESIMCGTPVITYDTCGSSESILPGCGEVVEKGNYEKMIRRALTLSENLEKIPVPDIFDNTKFCSKYYNLYQELMNSCE